MYKDLTIIRGWWGHLGIFDNKYSKQIFKGQNDFYQKVYVYGDNNFDQFKNNGFKDKLVKMGSEPFDYRLASNHTLYDHTYTPPPPPLIRMVSITCWCKRLLNFCIQNTNY